MILDYIGELLTKKGYVPIKTNARDIEFYALGLEYKNGSTVKMCMLVNNCKDAFVSGTQLEGMAKEFERSLLLKGMRNVDIMCIVSSDNINRDKELINHDIKFWIVNTKNNQLMVYDSQPLDYENLKNPIENRLSEPLPKKNISNTNKKNIPQLPYMTIILAAINILVFGIMVLAGDITNSQYLMKWGADSWQLVFKEHEYYRLFTSMFIHFSIEHLAYNMFALILSGNMVERKVGSIRFVIIYISSGLIGSIISCLHYMRLGEASLSAGASGAIYGIFGAIAATILRDNKNGAKKAQYVLIILLLMVFDGYRSEGIDLFAHFGGLIAGVIVTLLIYRRKRI